MSLPYLVKLSIRVLQVNSSQTCEPKMYHTLSESASFCKRYDKTFGAFFRFTGLTAVHLQNANFKFHKVGQRHYSGKVENTFLYDRFTHDNMSQILSRPGFVDDVTKTFGVFWGWQHSCSVTKRER